ncbi:MAG: biotin--[Treponema sp.]|nr:biotin--[acetyl-CoA-carboxylase] ligase [Treponema sp.]
MQLKNLKTNFLGRNLILYEEIDSTQSEIWRAVKNKDIKNGTVVAANIQTEGKGTHGRVWYTDEKNNIAFSFFINLNCNIKKLDGITTKAAEIILDIFKTKYEINLEIKEPNDIVYQDRKLGGILTETKLVGENVKYLVVGIGINTSKEKFTEDIKDVATSIKKEFGVDIDVKEFIAEFCNRFEEEIIKRSQN